MEKLVEKKTRSWIDFEMKKFIGFMKRVARVWLIFRLAGHSKSIEIGF